VRARRLLAGALTLAAGSATAASPCAAETDFLRDVLPILERSCVECHGEQTRESGLRLDSEAAVLRGSVWGPVVEPGRSDESPLYRLEAVGLSPSPAGEGETLIQRESGSGGAT
jgi:hypothetical protein